MAVARLLSSARTANEPILGWLTSTPRSSPLNATPDLSRCRPLARNPTPAPAGFPGVRVPSGESVRDPIVRVPGQSEQERPSSFVPCS